MVPKGVALGEETALTPRGTEALQGSWVAMAAASQHQRIKWQLLHGNQTRE